MHGDAAPRPGRTAIVRLAFICAFALQPIDFAVRAETLRPAPAGGGPARLVADLQTAPLHGSTLGDQDILVTDGGTYFKAVADLPVRRGQIWKTDGTAAGTVLLHEFSGVDATGMVEIDGVVLFGGRTWDHGAELWRTDGTPAGTSLVADLAPGPQGSFPQRLVRMGGAAYFVTSEDPARGLGRLHRTDGTTAGTRCVFPCEGQPPGVPAASPLAILDGVLYFTHVFGTLSELRRTDGTPEGTALVRPFALGPAGLTAADGRLYFSADDGLHGLEPWSSDGTTDGTLLAKDIRPGRFGSMDLSVRAALGPRLLFSAHDGARGLELWITDGTEAGTRLVKDLQPGPGGGFPHHILVDGSIAWFVAGSGPHGRDLWRTDGTEAGTSRVHTIAPDMPGLADVAPMALLGGRLYFAGWDDAHGWELWSSDGTPTGTALAADVRPGPAGSVEPAAQPRLSAGPGGRILFFADDAAHGREPWTSDGTAAGTALLRDANPLSGSAGSSPRALAAGGGLLWFMTSDPQAIWVTDGSSGGTRRLVDGSGGFVAADCYDQAAGDRLYALACPPDLWTSDGTPAGTRAVEDPLPAGAGRDISLPAPLGGGMLFVAESGTARLIWTDGTGEGARLVRELESVGFEKPQPLGDRLVFSAGGAGSGREPWITDGTFEGTLALLDLRPGPAESAPGSFTPLGGRVLFRAHDGVQGAELWVTDGTAAGTRLVRDLEPGPESSSFLLSPAASGATEAWFVAWRGTESRLWRTDGTDEGTRPVGPIFQGGGNRPHELTLSGGRLHFVAGPELWASDGTDEGTRAVRSFDRAPRALIDAGGALIFSAGEARPPLAPRDSLWRSDGSPEGTTEIQDIAPVPWQFDADREIAFVQAGRLLYFVGNDGVRGNEIWAGWVSVLAGDRAAALRDLSAEVAALSLPAGVAHALQATLGAADRGGTLLPFIRQVAALPEKWIAGDAARRLIELATDIDRLEALR
jgi:ELWxxDGT repeat protein